jgi:hypothetical protein
MFFKQLIQGVKSCVGLGNLDAGKIKNGHMCPFFAVRDS